LWSTTKKKSSEVLADENQEISQEKVKFLEFFSESENFSKIGGKSEIGGKCIMVSGGMDAPADHSLPPAEVYPGILWPKPIYTRGVYYGPGQFIPPQAIIHPGDKLAQAILYPGII